LEKSLKEQLANDIENRLDDFFDDNTPAPPAAVPAISLEKLKSVVLSIDWEITETCLTDLINESDALLPRFQKDRIPHALLRMLRAVGRYIRRHKAQAHPDAIKLVMSVFAGLEKIIGDPQMTDDTKREIVAKEITAFKKLKSQVERQYGTVAHSQNAEGKQSLGDASQDLKQAMNAVEQRLNSQVADLKEQMQLLQKELDNLRTR
jgi:phosphoenolpyruvate-protein kinase (PTS system EI component)